MNSTRTSGAPVGETIVDFLSRAVERHGPRDALLFKPAFRYQRWSYSRLCGRSRAGWRPCCNGAGLGKGDQAGPVGAQLHPTGC